METAMRSGHNELRAEELVTWKVAGELMTLSISHIEKKGDDTQTQREREREEETINEASSGGFWFLIF